MAIRKRGIRVGPRSINDIRTQATLVRTMLGITGGINMAKLIELVLPQVIPGFDFDVIEDRLMLNDHARTYPDSNEIVISASTYDGAISGVGRDNFTLAHEFGHLLLHKGINRGFSRLRNENEPLFIDSEWQADTFAAEFLMPYSELVGRVQSVSAVCENYKVSQAAAAYRLKKLKTPTVP